MNKSIHKKLKLLINCLLNKYSEQGHFDTELKDDTDFVEKLLLRMDDDDEINGEDLKKCNEIWNRNGCKKDDVESVEPLYFISEIPKE